MIEFHSIVPPFLLQIFAGQPVYLPCLVNIGTSILSYSFKRLYSYRVFHIQLLSSLFQEVGNRGDDGSNAGRTGSDTERLGKAHPALYLRRDDDFAAGAYLGVVSDLGKHPVHVEDISVAFLCITGKATCLINIICDTLTFNITDRVWIHNCPIDLNSTIVLGNNKSVTFS